MNEIAIKRHSFDLAKNRLKEFSEKTEAELEIDKVRTDGGFLGLGDHKVTGYELNRRLETIQEHFIAVNTTNNKVIKEFREIYNALDALDKDYITSIIANVKAIEKTSNDVRTQQKTLKQHNEKLANQQSKLDAHQAEIEKNVASIAKIVTALKVFKEKLEGYKHLTDIDKIWSDCKNIQNEIRKATENIETANNNNKALSYQLNSDIFALRNEVNLFKEIFSDLSEKNRSTTNLLDNQIPLIQENTSFIEHLKTVVHVDDIDSMWEDINKTKENFVTIANFFQNIRTDILKTQKRLERIDSLIAVLNSYTHLQDVDYMWEDLDVCKTNIERINGDIQTQKSELNTLTSTSSEHTESITAIFKKIANSEKYATDSRYLITKLEDFRSEISALNHLMEVDEIWKQAEEHQVRINLVEQKCKAHTDKLNELKQADIKILENIASITYDITLLREYQKKLNEISHLDDVDDIWEDTKEHTSKLIECEKRDEELANAIQKNKEEANENIVKAVQTTDATIGALKKKVKFAFWIAGGSVGLAIIELILLLMKVI